VTTILITGTNRGIGYELATQALAKDWTVFGSARSEVSGPQADICQHPNFHELQFDVCDHDAVMSAAASVEHPIDIIINNAGVIGPDRQSSLDMDFDGFERTLSINTVAPLRIAQAFLSQLKQSTKPRLITISSAMGSMAGTSFDRIAYRASKAAVNKVMQGLAHDLRRDGITVVSMHPGWVQTDMGGPGADITARESASGILGVADRLELADSGSFFNYDGSAIAW